MVAVCEVALFKVMDTLEVLEAKHHSTRVELASGGACARGRPQYAAVENPSFAEWNPPCAKASAARGRRLIRRLMMMVFSLVYISIFSAKKFFLFLFFLAILGARGVQLLHLL